MSTVFISYAHEDEPFVVSLADRLARTKAGFVRGV